MKLLSYEFDKNILIIKFESSFSSIRLRFLESPTQIQKDSCLTLESTFMQIEFSTPKSELSLCLSRGTQFTILIIEKIDEHETYESMMLSRQLESDYIHTFASLDGEDYVHEKEQVGLGNGLEMLLAGVTSTEPFQKNESKGIYATIRRKTKRVNGNR